MLEQELDTREIARNQGIQWFEPSLTLDNHVHSRVLSSRRLLEGYSHCLNKERSLKKSWTHEPEPRRKKLLESALCRRSQLLLNYSADERGVVHRDLHKIWKKFLGTLINNLKHNCNKVYTYNAHVPKWEPPLFGFLSNSTWRSCQWRKETRKRIIEDYENVSRLPGWNDWYSIASLWEPLGACTQTLYNGIAIDAKNVQKCFLIHALQVSVGVRVADVRRFIDFGGGTTITARVLYLGDFRGEYIMYDFLPMNLLQEFFLRLVKIPAVLVQTNSEIERFPQGLLLISDLDKLESVVRVGKRDGGRNVFWASYSLSETPYDLRNRILPVITEFTDYFIVFARPKGQWDDQNPKKDRWGGNFAYFRDAVQKELFGIGASACMWHAEGLVGATILAASKVNKVKCEVSAGCTPESQIYCK